MCSGDDTTHDYAWFSRLSSCPLSLLLPARYVCGSEPLSVHVLQNAEGSTVVDMTSNPPVVLRRGLGDAAVFDAMAEDLVPA